MDLHERLADLAKLRSAESLIVSVCLGSRFTDEHERDRVRVFLKSEIKKARDSRSGHAIKEDLDWIEGHGETPIEGARFPEARGVALFACKTLGLREVIPVGRPLEDAFVVAEAPYLTPLVALLGAMPSLLVVFVDGGRRRRPPPPSRKPLRGQPTDRIAGSVSGTKHEAASVILGRAAELLARLRA